MLTDIAVAELTNSALLLIQSSDHSPEKPSFP